MADDTRPRAPSIHEWPLQETNIPRRNAIG